MIASRQGDRWPMLLCKVIAGGPAAALEFASRQQLFYVTQNQGKDQLEDQLEGPDLGVRRLVIKLEELLEDQGSEYRRPTAQLEELLEDLFPGIRFFFFAVLCMFVFLFSCHL